MIIIELDGGLGNQLFQYAIGHSVAKKNNTELKVDLRSYSQSDFRNYELPTLGLNPSIVSHLESYRIRLPELYPWRLLPSKSLNHFKFGSIIKETKAGTYTPELFPEDDNLYLRGYWQTEKYFNEYASEIVTSLSYQGKFKNDFKKWSEKIANINNPIAIHIRRTDYVSNPKANATHGILDWDYYQKAVSILKNKNKQINIIYFSDDPKWVLKEIVPKQKGLLIDTKITEPAFELMLMSLCRDFIIANSSYSWWAAYLGKNKNKTIIAPKKWFKNSKYKAPDITPNTWIKI